jgi:SAM-dependent methyltransferase
MPNWLSRLVEPRKPALVRIRSYLEFCEYQSVNGREIARRKEIERELSGDKCEFFVTGYCYVCSKKVNFKVNEQYSWFEDGRLVPNYREHMNCPLCGLNNRTRAAIHIMEKVAKRGGSVYITEQVTPLFGLLNRRLRHIIGSEYLGSTIKKGSHNIEGIRNESILDLSFPDSIFDTVLCFDVMEHVPDFPLGFSECYRVMKPGGTLLFSVPFYGTEHTRIRARVAESNKIEHFLTPEYHGDPVTSAGCLCFYNFGWDLLQKVREVGFEDVVALFYYSRDWGYLGNGDQTIFLASKPSDHGR